MNQRILFGLVLFLLVASLSLGVSLEYTVQASGVKTLISSIDSQVQSCFVCDNGSGNCTEFEVCENRTLTTNTTSESPWSASRTLSLSCELNCDYPLPIFDVPANVDRLNYTLSAKTLPPKVMLYFKNARSWVTKDPEDQVHLSVNTSIVCSSTQCDSRCTKCLDGGCYPPGYACPSVLLKLDKVSPKQLELGQAQLNVFVSNLYQSDASNVDAKVSGAGIKTLSSIPIGKIFSKDKDAVVLTVKVDESGTIDVLVRITGIVGGEEVALNEYAQVEVKAKETVPPVKISESEVEKISKEINQDKDDLNSLELEYQKKKADGYLVSELYDRVKYVRGLLQEAQKSLLDNKYEDAKKTLSLVASSLDDLRQALQESTKVDKSLKDTIKDNALLITTIIGALVAVIGFLEKNKDRFSKLKDKTASIPDSNKEEDEGEGKKEEKTGKWFSVEKVNDSASKKKRR
ncbi:MAG: hypothetical protein AABX70_06610 [Nanoarchaeota archaeon]